MNKPTRIVPPDETHAAGSLFERAGAAFGLDRLRPARLPANLPEGNSRLPAPRASEDPVSAAAPEPVQVAADPDPAPPAPMVQHVTNRPVEVQGPAVRFTGIAHPVSRERLRDEKLIDTEAAAGALLEEFRIVKRQILATMLKQGTAMARRLLVTSPHMGDGKTFCATNLALALAAEQDIEVVLVDADVAKPSVLERLGLPAGPGLMDALSDPSAAVERLVLRTDIPNFHVLPAGRQTQRDAEYLAGERTWDVLGRLTRGAPNRVLVFDSPPALAASPAAELARHVGQVLLVARADRTPRAALEDAVDLLGACADIRLLLNDATFSPSGRSFGRYYGPGG